jgi:hypothetical protein
VERARTLFAELKSLEDIKICTENEPKHWWAFVTPEMLNGGRLDMPDVLREEFVKAVDRSIEKINKLIEEL